MRDEFERWIAAPPIEANVKRYPETGAWPGNYRDYKVQLALEAWAAGSLNERKACAIACEVHAARVQKPNSGTPWSACHECAEIIQAR